MSTAGEFCHAFSSGSLCRCLLNHDRNHVLSLMTVPDTGILHHPGLEIPIVELGVAFTQELGVFVDLLAKDCIRLGDKLFRAALRTAPLLSAFSIAFLKPSMLASSRSNDSVPTPWAARFWALSLASVRRKRLGVTEISGWELLGAFGLILIAAFLLHLVMDGFTKEGLPTV